MKLSAHKVKQACRRKQLRLREALGAAGVSQTAYYSLLRNDSVLPKSLLALAEFLDVEPRALLDDSVGPELRARLMIRQPTFRKSGSILPSWRAIAFGCSIS